jgi:hypothetical protein
VGDKEQTVVRHGPLFELATKQHGVVSTRQLAAIGYSRSSASKAHGVQRLRRIHRGVYLVGHERLTWHGRCMAAVLACAPAVASHTAAAWLHGLLRRPPGTIHLTAPTRRRAKAGFSVHFAALLDRDVAEVDAIPAIGWARRRSMTPSVGRAVTPAPAGCGTLSTSIDPTPPSPAQAWRSGFSPWCERRDSQRRR